MRKKLLIVGLILTLVISIIIFLWQHYDLSSDYNYATAKLDIKNGDVKIVHVGVPIISSKDKEIEIVAAKYGFKNVNITIDTTKQKMNGINNYNEAVEVYLNLRNGANWRIKYQKEVDSLYKVAFNQDNNLNR